MNCLAIAHEDDLRRPLKDSAAPRCRTLTSVTRGGTFPSSIHNHADSGASLPRARVRARNEYQRSHSRRRLSAHGLFASTGACEFSRQETDRDRGFGWQCPLNLHTNAFDRAEIHGLPAISTAAPRHSHGVVRTPFYRFRADQAATGNDLVKIDHGGGNGVKTFS